MSLFVVLTLFQVDVVYFQIESILEKTHFLVKLSSRKAGKMLKIFTVLQIFLLCIISFAYSAIDTEIENKNVEIDIDLNSQLVKKNFKIFLDHKSKKNINSYTFLLPHSDCEKLSYFSAKDASKKELKTQQSKYAGSQDCSFAVQLNSASPSPTIYIEVVLARALEPYPTAITQNEKQLVRYFGNAHFYSPFKTISQKTTIHLASRNVESFTQVKPSSHSDTTITYGPYENIGREYFDL